MKTYSQLEKEKPIDWNKRLAKKNITNEDWQDWSSDAASWVTCACGNQCAILPRHTDGEPVDEDLAELGRDFSDNITGQDAETAKKTLKAIEKRSAVLVNQELKKLKNMGIKIC